MSLAQHFWRHLQQHPERTLIERLEPNGHVAWRQTRGALRDEASQWMAALRAAGIGQGDRVALSLGKSAGLVTAHLAVLGVGAGVVPLNPALTARETEAVLEKADVRLAITHAETVARAADYRDCARSVVDCRGRKRVTVRDHGNHGSVGRSSTWTRTYRSE